MIKVYVKNDKEKQKERMKSGKTTVERQIAALVKDECD